MSRGIFLVVAIFTRWAAAAQLESSIYALPPTVICGTEGRLPDPTDCSYYIDCTSDGDSGLTFTTTPCPAGTYYNACCGNCSLTEQPENCAVACTQATNGVTTVSPQNPGVYSLCFVYGTVSYVIVSACPDGGSIDNTTGECGSQSTNCPISGGSSATTCNGTYYYGDQSNCSIYYYCSDQGEDPAELECPTDEYYISYNHTCVSFSCPSPGFFADPVDCTRYYYCDLNNNTDSLGCPDGSYFNSSLGGCHLGNCSNTCPGAGGSSGGGGGGGDDGGGGGSCFSCPSSGFFADPYNCSRFYYCDNNQNPTLLDCPRGSHFNSTAGGCILGDCAPPQQFSSNAHNELLDLHADSAFFRIYKKRTLKMSERNLREAGLFGLSVDNY